MLKKIFSFSNATLFVALALSTVAAWYSIIGLTAIFAGAVIPVIIMGTVLEIAKVTTTVWLRKYWKFSSWMLKLYLVPAVMALALMTSMGIFGFLSKAHMEQGVGSGDVQAKVSLLDEKIAIQRENIKQDRAMLAQMDTQVNDIMSKGDSERSVERSVTIRKQQANERTKLLKDIELANKEIQKLNEERAPIASELRKAEAEVGPIKYIAAFIYGDNPDQNLLERAVRWVIVLLVIVFDPLAILLVIGANQSKEWDERLEEEQRKKYYEPDDGLLTDDQLKQIVDDVEVPENLQTKTSIVDEVDEPINCYKCNTPLVDAPGIGLYCPNKECDVLDGPQDPNVEPVTFTYVPTDNSVSSPEEEEEFKKIPTQEPVVTQVSNPDSGGFLKQHTLSIREQEPSVEESILDKHPYLNQPFTHFTNLTPVVSKNTDEVSEPQNTEIIATGVDVVDRPGDYITDTRPETGPNYEGIKVNGEWVQTGPAFNEPQKEEIDTSHPFNVVHDDYVEYEGKKMHKRVLASLRPDLGIIVDDPVEPYISFGDNFPKHPKLGDMFTRIDVVPHRIFKFNGRKWIEISRSNTDSHLEEKYIQYLIDKISTGEYDADHLTPSEQDAIAQYIKNTAPNI